MNVKVNGEDFATEKRTLMQLLGERGVVPGQIAVEVNLKVVKRADYESAVLKEGDVIEIVRFVGGG